MKGARRRTIAILFWTCWSLPLMIVLLSCTKKNKEEFVGAKSYGQRSAHEIRIPRKLWDELNKMPISSGGGSGAGASKAGHARKVEWFPLKVFLKEENRGILNGENREISYREGGGELDFAEFVNASKNGFFRMKIEPGIDIGNEGEAGKDASKKEGHEEKKTAEEHGGSKEEKESKDGEEKGHDAGKSEHGGGAEKSGKDAKGAGALGAADKRVRVFFLGKTKRRKIGEKYLGIGCEKFVDVTTYFHKAMKEGGILATNVKDQYLSLLGGIFVFVQSQDDVINISQLSVFDSRHPELSCDNMRTKK